MAGRDPPDSEKIPRPPPLKRGMTAEAGSGRGAMRFSEALAGASAGAMTVLLLHPLDTLKTRLQASREARGARAAARALLAGGGVGAIYSGAVPALVGSATAWGIYFQSFYAARGLLAPFFAGSTARDLSAGTIAGVFTSVLTNPIWVIKVRLQLQGGSGGAAPRGVKPYRGLVHTLRTILHEEGVRGFYRGLGPSIWLVSHGAIQFTLYERFKAMLKDDAFAAVLPGNAAGAGTSVAHSMLASTASKLFASIAAYPLQVVRTRMQERNASRTCYSSLPKASWHILKYEGIRGFYRGLWANVARVIPQTAVTFVTYEQALRLFSR